MKKELLRFTLYAIIIYLTSSTLNPVIASPQPSGGHEIHFCGVIDGQSRFHRSRTLGTEDSKQPDKLHLDQFPNRHYARAFAANLNVGELRTVRLIYFTPNDWPYRADVVQKMKDTIRTVQTFYTEQMDAHGYGPLTFRFETDPQGEPTVHHVVGDHPFSYYDNTLGSEVFSELQRAYDFNANIYFVVLGTDALRQGDGVPALGVGYQFAKNGGVCLVPNQFSWDLVAHELGHTFGLNHDFRDNTYIMSYGGGARWSLSACAAEFLSVHSYFNPDTPIEEEEPPTIKPISPRFYLPGSTSILVRVQVSDTDGLHQLLLYAVGALQLCRNFTGEKEAIIEFEYDGGFGQDGFRSFPSDVTQRVRVDIVDTDGNVSDTLFGFAERSPYHIATLEGHTEAVRSVSFSPDGTILTSGSMDKTIKLWDVAARQNIVTLEWHANGVDLVSFSPDGRTLVSTSGLVMLWDVVTRQNIVAFSASGFARIDSASFSPDGRTLAYGDSDGMVNLWDVTTRTRIVALSGHQTWVLSVAFSPDGTILASGGADRTVKLWDVATRQNIGTLTHGRAVFSVSFSPDGTTLASGSEDSTVKLWDVATRQNIGTLTHGSVVSSVSFSPDGGTLVSGGWDGTVKLWDMLTRTSFATFPHTSGVYSVSFSPDGGTLASGTSGGTVELWDMSGLMGARVEALTEIDIPDPNLRAAIAEQIGLPLSAPIVRGHLQALTHLFAESTNINDLTGLEHAINLRQLFLWDNTITDISPLSGLTDLSTLHLSHNAITDISPLSGLTHLRELWLWGNNISDLSALSGLTHLRDLDLSDNAITDLSPLVANTELGSGDTVNVQLNLLSYAAIHTHILALQSRGVTVQFDNQAHPALLKISGDNQTGASFVSLSQPFVVEAQDANGSALAGISVTFAATAGGGTLSTTITRTDTSGRAQSTLTLGPNLGTNTVQVSAAGIEVPATFHAISDTESPSIAADVNSDGSVNVLDLVVIASELGKTGTNLAVDVNGDGVVNILDLVLVAGMFDGVAAAPSAQPQVTFTAIEVQDWLIDARTLEVKDPTMKRGVMMLEQLLVSLTPKETELLANYPNPFNPETWIAYHLAEEANVTLTIYDTTGIIVRQLELGHQLKGYYTDRDKAAYWEGKDELGESVASGIYFYTLTTGDYSATRKMVILK